MAWSCIALPHLSDKTLPPSSVGAVGRNPRGGAGSLLADLGAGSDGRLQARNARTDPRQPLASGGQRRANAGAGR